MIDQHRITMVGAEELRPHPRNPRRGDVETIRESIETNGWIGTLVVQRSTGHILAGNHRFEAGRQLGMETFPVFWVDADDEAALRILLADNRTSDLATYDEEQLVMIIQDLTDPKGTGFTAADVEQIEAGLRIEPMTVKQVDTPAGLKEMYESTTLRQVTLIMDAWEYGPVLDTFTTIREREKLDTNAAVVLWLLAGDLAGSDLVARIAAEKQAMESTVGDA